MELSRVTTKGQITLPASIRKRFGIDTGQQVIFEATTEGILVKPVRIEDQTQAPEWKQKLQIALNEARTGKGSFYGNEEEFLAALTNNFAKPKRTAVKKPKRA